MGRGPRDRLRERGEGLTDILGSRHFSEVKSEHKLSNYMRPPVNVSLWADFRRVFIICTGKKYLLIKPSTVNYTFQQFGFNEQ